jgi:hypothetical protein
VDAGLVEGDGATAEFGVGVGESGASTAAWQHVDREIAVKRQRAT